MMHKQNRRIRYLFPLLLLVAVVIGACSAGAQPAAAPTDTPAGDADTPAFAAETPVTDAAATSATAQIFTIDPSQSEARFTLHEELMGAPKTVVGATSVISGAITIDPADPTQTRISPIQIDARDFSTDSNRRDGAIRRFILQSNSDANRYILFTPTAVTGLPTTVAVGDSFDLQITGDLTISGVTNPVTFATTVTVESDTQISGLATAQVLRSDFDLTIPSVPSVANVTDDVQLALQFVANAE